ncbi:ribonuclease HII [candidate division KSB1 bacterium]|nr:ribonuclease HII [candidate division KSB1 bacterium]
MLDIETSLWKRGYAFVAGIDEAGRGPLAGPVVAAAVVFPKEQPLLTHVIDSKKLSSKRRSELMPLIRQNAVAVGIGIVSEKIIDNLNILQATLLAMQQAIEDLTLEPDYLLIDGNRAPDTPVVSQTLVGGDGLSMSVAAASIVAKVTRDNMMIEYDKKYPCYGFARHKGYPTWHHRHCIIKHGICPLHRRSFNINGRNGNRDEKR